jgi:hypothetical protein
MRKAIFSLAAALVAAVTVTLAAGPAPAVLVSRQSSPPVPTFARDVAPVLYSKCAECHRPGEIGPMSLLTYEEARPWARAIARRVSDGTMPPWHAEASDGTFTNERKLTAQEKDVIARWVAGGAPAGDRADMPPPPAYVEGWTIGKPDLILEMAEDYRVPADGAVAYEYFYLPTNLTEAKWVEAIEIRPGNRALVHHVLAFYQAPPDTPRAPQVLKLPAHMKLPPRITGDRPPQETKVPNRLIATYTPGSGPMQLKPGAAMRLAPGGVIELQMHYTTNGTAASDRTRVGLIFAKHKPTQEVRASHFFNAQFTIPAGAADYRVDSEVGFAEDVTLRGVFPHTHLRGKQWEYKLELPDGTVKRLLSVPRYDFNWQTYYVFNEPIAVPRGSRIVSSAWYDNSAGNRANPDPKIAVTWGDQTWEEMQYTGLLYSVAPSGRAATSAAQEP